MKFENAVFETSFGTSSQLIPSDMPEIAFSGRSNVGKSSLLNRLMGRKSLAHVSSTPGKTSTINFYRLDECRLVDLPGYGYARVSQGEKQRWAELLEAYFQNKRDLRLVVQLLDIRIMMTEQDEEMMSFIYDADLPFIVVLTKIDKLNKSMYLEMLNNHTRYLGRFGDFPVIPVSARTGKGVDELRTCIEAYLHGEAE